MTKSKKPQWFTWFSRGQHPVLINDLMWRTLIIQPKITGAPCLNFYKRDISNTYFDRSEHKNLVNVLKSQLKNNPQKLFKRIKGSEKIYKSILSLAKKYNVYNWKRASNEEIKRKVIFFLERYIPLFCYTYYPIWLGDWAGEELLKELFKKLEPKKCDKIIWQITRSIKLTTREKFDLALLRLACQIKKSGKKPNFKNYQKDINGIIKNFGYLPAYLFNIRSYTKEEIWGEVKHLLSENPCQLRKEKINNFKQRIKERQFIFKKLSPRIQKIVDVLTYDVWLREERLIWYGKICSLVYPLFCEAARRRGFTYQEFIQQRISEMKSVGISKEEAQTRVRGYTYIVENGVITILPLQEKNRRLFSRQRIIKGRIANKGKVRGRVRIGTAYTFYQIKPGEIVVTGMTTPEAAVSLRRAAAFVTDEGGITCHAAIVSRELKIPCIIGTKIATKVLHDGQLVEVDANKGVVRILKRKEK